MVLFHIFICFSLVSTCFTESDDGYKSYENHKIYHIQGDKQGLDKIMQFLTKNHEIPFHAGTDTGCQMLVAPNLVPIVESVAKTEGLTAKVIVDDYSKLIRDEKINTGRQDGFSWTAYYDVDNIYGYLQNMSNQHSNWTQLVVGGQSYEGRQILGLRINTPSDEDKPAMFIESGIHAREWITPATTTYFINQLLTSSDPEITSLRDQFDWHIFPTVNPDGYHYSFTKFYNMIRFNGEGKHREETCMPKRFSRRHVKSGNPHLASVVDYSLMPLILRGDPCPALGQLMDFGSSDNPCNYQLYAGPKPFSEIETRTLSKYISGLENMIGYLAFHSDAQTLLLPYSDSAEHIDNYDDLKQIGESSLRYGYAVNQAKYDGPGTAAEILYKVSGGSMDWVRETQGTPLVYTYELRGTYFYWPPSRIYEQGDEVTQMMVGLVQEARNLGYF